MDKEFNKQINQILEEQEIDERLTPLLKLYFTGKFKLGGLTIEQLKSQINTLCSKITNVEFSSNDIVVAYSGKARVLTINKQLFLDKKSDEVILPVFTKFEGILNHDNRKVYANYIEDFIRAGQVAKICSVPISDKLYKLYEMAEYCYGDIEDKTDELARNDSWKAICSNYNTAINTRMITGKDDLQGLFDGARLFHNEVFTEETFSNPNFEGAYKNAEYQQKAARILEYISSNSMQTNANEYSLIRNIRLFTGCRRKMIEESRTISYKSNTQISSALEKIMQSSTQKISEEFIVSKVQAVLDRKQDWDARIKYLIIPFFLRSQKIYGWNLDEFQERLNELDLKIDQIVFEDLESITNAGNTAGNKIKLNSRICLDSRRKIF